MSKKKIALKSEKISVIDFVKEVVENFNLKVDTDPVAKTVSIPSWLAGFKEGETEFESKKLIKELQDSLRSNWNSEPCEIKIVDDV